VSFVVDGVEGVFPIDNLAHEGRGCLTRVRDTDTGGASAAIALNLEYFSDYAIGPVK
jgi:hypothetical protein